MIIIFNLSGLAIIGFIIWWFWLAKSPNQAIATEAASITVIVANGVYDPEIIRTQINQKISLTFMRKDPSPCAAKVIFQDFDISADLPPEKPYNISFTPNKIGEFEFTCQMGMYRGKLIVE